MSKLLEQTLKKLQKDYGEAISDVKESGIVKRLPTSSPNMNYVLGGGIPLGRISVLMGLESAGKCYDPDTRILTNKGYISFREISDIYKIVLDDKEEIIPLDTELKVKNHEGNWSKISNFTKNGIKKTKKLTTNSGISITATLNNPILVAGSHGTFKWKNMEDITTEDYVLHYKEEPFKLTEFNEEAYMLGVFIADGYFNNKFITVTNDDPDIITFLEKAKTLFNFTMSVTKKNNSSQIQFNTIKSIKDFYSNFNLKPGVAKNKKVPGRVFTKDKNYIASFLQGYYDCESSVSDREIEVSSASKELLEQIQLLLNQLGYRSFLRVKKVKTYPNNWYGRLTMYGEDAINFIDNISFKSQRRIEEGKKFVYRGKTNHNSIPLLKDRLLCILYDIPKNKRTRETWKAFSDITTDKCNTTYSALLRVKEYLISIEEKELSEQIQELLDIPYYYDRVVSIEDSKEMITCDIEVLDGHSFIGNGLVVHNTIIASYLGGQIQKQKDVPNVVCFIDMEHTFDRNYASVVGLDTEDDSKFIFVRPKHGEEGFEIMKSLAETGEIGMFIWDSVASTPSAKALAKEVGSATFGGTASVMADGLKIVNPILSRYKVPSIFLNQLRAKIGGMPGYGPQENMKVGGYALPFYSSWSAKVSRIEDILDKKETIGIKIRVKNTKSKIGIPKRTADLDLYFQTGFNPDMEYIDFIINFGYVQKAGAWLSNEEWGMKVQGRNGLLDYLKTNQDLFESLKKEVNDSFSRTTVLDVQEESEEESTDDSVDPLFA